MSSDTAQTAWLPDLLYTGGRFRGSVALVSDASGRVAGVVPADELKRDARVVRLAGRAVLPGMVNAHSHAFQRVIRGRTEHRGSQASDSFWTWREQMYAAAARLTPEDLYDASRMAFMEMALSGVTSVGEFHYLHRAPDGAEYDDPNLLAKEVVRAARDTGLRIALLRVAYARSGFQTPPNERQRRFIEPDPDTFIRHAEALADELAREEPAGVKEPMGVKKLTGVGESAAGRDASDASTPTPFAWAGVAPHSVRAVPLEYLVHVSNFADTRRLPVHMHVAEQPAEIAACVAETGLTPVSLLDARGLLNTRFTAVHAVHVRGDEMDALARAGSTVCACPTTERNLGDGIVPADEMLARGLRVALGTDSHTQIDLLEDARELEYHLRLRRLERNVLAPQPKEKIGDGPEALASDGAGMFALAARLFECATVSGAHSIGADSGELTPGRAADFFTVDLGDPSIAGASSDDLLPAIVFSLARTALRETVVGGRLVVEAGRHAEQDEIVSRFRALQHRLWS